MDTRDQITEPPLTSAPAWANDAGEDVEDFSRALDQWEAGLKSLKEGDVVQGRVIKILDKEVIVDIGYKSEGVVDIDEFRAPDGSVTVKEGDRLEVLLEKAEDEDGYVVLSKEKAEKMKVWDEVERAYETGEAHPRPHRRPASRAGSRWISGCPPSCPARWWTSGPCATWSPCAGRSSGCG
jgi:transcriptional accessory protein Tex/SPT6